MSPTIPTGSLALSRTVQADEIGVGDIVTVPNNGAYLTHRVINVTHAADRATLIMRGDGNRTPDDVVHEVTSAPRTELWVPHVGRVVAWFSHAPGVYVLAGWVAIVIGSLRRQRPSEPTAPRRRPGPPKLLLELRRLLARLRDRGRAFGPHLARGAMATAVFVATPMVALSPAMAAWADSVGMSGTSIKTVNPNGVTPSVTCTDLGSTVVLSWTSITAATHYLISYGGLGADRVESETVPSTVTSRTFDGLREGRFDVIARFGSDTWISPRSSQVSYTKGNCG